MTSAATAYPDAFADSLARAGSTSADLFRLIADSLREKTGAKLVTVTAVDPRDLSYERLYSSMPEVYPVSGRKPANTTRWSQQVMEKQEVFVANDYKTLAEAMPDHETIRSIGCESLVNVPLVLFGQVIGTLNCLAGSGHFSDDRVQACKDMRLPIILGIVADNDFFNDIRRRAAGGNLSADFAFESQTDSCMNPTQSVGASSK